MNTTFPTDGIQNLILNKKGDRSYERLARDCGHEIKSRALHAAATKQTRAFADPDTIRGLSQGLNVPVVDIIRAYSVSLGLPVAADEKGILRVVGGGDLPESSQNLIVSMARELRSAYETPVEPSREDLDLAAYDTGEESEGDRVRRQQDEETERPATEDDE
ncbi:hypothetical protein [Arthrobacter pityocampae]|uniref:hypothetical protein n=1 Tax=Arthrobacter pityocampae TaxID=547334 RepID=UPI003734EBF1